MDPIPENSIVFNGFGKDIGDTLSLLKFEFEELEKNKVALQKVEDVDKAAAVDEIQPSAEVEVKNDNNQPLKKSYSMSIKAHMYDSLKNVRKRLHIKRKHQREYKIKNGVQDGQTSSDNSTTEESPPVSRYNSLSSNDYDSSPDKEQNNNVPIIQIQSDPSQHLLVNSEGSNVYSTLPRKPKATKRVERSKTLSPQKPCDIPGLSPVPRVETLSTPTPPVVIGGNLVYDYQYNRHLLSPAAGEEKAKVRSKVGRNQSMSKILRLVRSPHKSNQSLNKTNDTPLRELYLKTVMSQSVPYSMNNIGTSPQESPEKSPSNNGFIKRHNSTSTTVNSSRFIDNTEYYSTLPLPRKQK